MKVTKNLLREAIRKLDEDIPILKLEERNPQVNVLIIQKQAKREAFQACLDSLEGNHIFLKLHI